MDATGPSHGISEIAREAEAPSVPNISPLFSPSKESTFMKMCVSLLNPSGNNGRKGLSVNRAPIISFSEGRASRLKNPPGIFPDA